MNWVRFVISAFLLASASTATTFNVRGTDPAPWAKILGAVGITLSAEHPAITVVTAGVDVDIAAQAKSRIVVVEGLGPAVQRIGFEWKSETVSIRQITDVHAPNMQTIWEQPVSVPAVAVPAGFQVFAKERWKGAPVLAGKRIAQGAILWLAASPGPSGIERFPYLLNALADLGLPVEVQSPNLWAFFDSSYRIRADVEYLARRWRKAGISALHVAAWHNMEPDKVQDDFLQRLIAACHRNAILVYAWLELPHVSEQFWAAHPSWREKTALGQDAQLDWRKLMNLQNPQCRQAIATEVGRLLQRFDWDGVNVAELYFESLEGAANPARFTPMNDDVRADFKKTAGWDPQLLFDPASSYSAGKNSNALRQFLDFRAALATRMQGEWLDLIGKSKLAKPYLDLTLTHIDDRFEPGIRDALGADVARSLPLIRAHQSTLLIEDPATLWSLGPERYAKLASQYKQLTPNRQDLAVDINVVERYQDVYPTKKQTGVELLELVHQAAESFGKVALYFENSIERQDLSLLPVAASTAKVSQKAVDELEVESVDSVRIAWRGPVEMDGKLWPVQDSETVWTPAGKHKLTPAVSHSAVTLTDFNGNLQSAVVSGDSVDLSYRSRTRAVATFAGSVSAVEVDGAAYSKPSAEGDCRFILLPSGQHLVTLHR